MKFAVIKSSPDGIASVMVDGIEAAAEEVFCHDGWESLAAMRKAIMEWGPSARPGEVFKTPRSAIVCAALNPAGFDVACDECGEEDDVDWKDLGPVEDGNVEQEAECQRCGHRWQDVFAPSERRVLFKRGRFREAGA